MLCKALSLLLVLSTLFCVSACSSTKSEPSLPRDASGQVIDDGTERLLVSLADLRKKLAGISDDFLQVSAWAAEKVRREDDSYEVHRETLVWEQWAFGFTRHILSIEDPRIGWIDVWSLAYQMEDFVSEGEGSEVYGKGQATIVDATTKFREKVERVMERSLSRTLYAQVQPAIKGWAADHRMAKGTRAMHRPDLESMKKRTGFNPIGSVLSVPAAPFKAIGGASSGIKGAPEAIRFAATTLADTIEYMPHMGRLEAMLLLHDLRRNPIVADAMDLGERVTKSIEDVPDNVTRVLNDASGTIGPIVADAKVATGDIREATANVKETVENVRPMPKEIEAVVTNVRTDIEGALKTVRSETEPILAKSEVLSRSVRSTVQEVRGLMGDLDRSGAESRARGDASLPMDRLPDMIDNARITAEQARLATADVRAMMAPEDMERTMKAMGAVGRDSIDHISWRAIQVALAIFMLAIAYRVIRVRWLKG